MTPEEKSSLNILKERILEIDAKPKLNPKAQEFITIIKGFSKELPVEANLEVSDEAVRRYAKRRESELTLTIYGHNFILGLDHEGVPEAVGHKSGHLIRYIRLDRFEESKVEWYLNNKKLTVKNFLDTLNILLEDY